jgi:hypothetical protein
MKKISHRCFLYRPALLLPALQCFGAAQKDFRKKMQQEGYWVIESTAKNSEEWVV